MKPRSKVLAGSLLRDAMAHADRAVEYVGVGLVYVPDGAAGRTVEDEDGSIRLHVRKLPHGEPLRCLMAGLGVMRAPAAGERVALIFPTGDVSDEMHGPIALLGITDHGHAAFDVRDVVLQAHSGGKVKLGAMTGTVPLALAPNVEARLQALEAHRHFAPASGGTTSEPILMSAAYQEQWPTSPDELTQPNPPHGDPFHVHDDDAEPTTISAPMGSGAGCAATACEGI